MIPNIFSGLSLKDEPTSDATLSPEDIAAEAKADRIRFHREKVRNGPVSFRDLTNGQVRRLKARSLKRQERKSFRAEVRNYFEKQRLAALVRAHLQIAGVLPYVDGHTADTFNQIRSTGWLVQRFGTEIEVDGEKTGHVSFLEADVVDAMKRAVTFYTSATGHIVSVPADFVPAISLSTEDASA